MVFLAIHLVMPAVGVALYLKVRARMMAACADDAPTTRLFLLFFAFGGLLTVVLTELFWYWSGAASLGLFALMLMAPALILIAIHTAQERHRSASHLRIFKAALAYPLVFFLLMVAVALKGP